MEAIPPSSEERQVRLTVLARVRSRLRSPFVLLRLVGVLIMIVNLIGIAAGFHLPPLFRGSTSTIGHKAFVYTDQAGSSCAECYNYHSGDQVNVVWSAEAAGSTESPSPILLSFALYGPFISIDELRSAVGAIGHQPTTRPLVQAASVRTTSWTNTSYTFELSIPKHVKPGFYDLLSAEVEGSIQISRTDSVGSLA